MVMKWHGDEAAKRIRSEAGDRLDGAAMFLRGKARENISRAQPTRLVHPTAGGSRRVGLAPSLPGEFPKKVSGYLRRGVASETDRTILQARVGTNVSYGKWLELSTRKMASRPWLLRTVVENVPAIEAKFGVGHQI